MTGKPECEGMTCRLQRGMGQPGSWLHAQCLNIMYVTYFILIL